MSAPFRDPKVKAVFDAFPAGLRAPLLKLRALILSVKKRVPDKALRHCIALALTYHARK